MKEPENKRMFKAKYLGPTNTKGSRFKIIDTRHKGKSFTYSWDYSKRNRTTGQALEIFKKCNINIEGYSESSSEDYWYFFTSDFKTMLTK
tara:strand:+ start:102 stop:371 length:270 start_codon:yes stop_codon:yes gene_type:complete